MDGKRTLSLVKHYVTVSSINDCHLAGSSVSRSTAPPVNKHQSNNAPLPDIVPESRDRSVSRPEMPSISQRYEQEVAQRLRRINDEFGFASETDRMVHDHCLYYYPRYHQITFFQSN